MKNPMQHFYLSMKHPYAWAKALKVHDAPIHSSAAPPLRAPNGEAMCSH